MFCPWNNCTFMNPFYRLYPDCILVCGRVQSAIYDLTRGNIHLIPNSLASLIEKDTIDLGQDNAGIQELLGYLNENELGRYGMSEEIKEISKDFECPSIISNAIIEIDKQFRELPLQRIACELSELLCEAVYLHFVSDCDIDSILNVSECFNALSFRSIDIGVRYHEKIMCDVEKMIENIPLCSKIIVSGSPYNQTSIVGRDIALRFTDSGQSCTNLSSKRDYSKWAIPKLPLYLESLRFNNCLYKKVCIDRVGNIRNCPASSDAYGNVINSDSLTSIVQSSDFQKLWTITNDLNNKCCDCELRYACQCCIFDRTTCAYR